MPLGRRAAFAARLLTILSGALVISGWISGVDVVMPAAEANSLAISLAIATDSAWCRGDQDRLHQVVANLLSNAIKFTPSGGAIAVRLDRAGDELRLQVRDSGRGIDPAFLPHLFDQFRQADSTTTRTVGGLGLGLSIARSIVVLHGGRISAESSGVGTGATFTVYLPAASLTGADARIPDDMRTA